MLPLLATLLVACAVDPGSIDGPVEERGVRRARECGPASALLDARGDVYLILGAGR